MCSAVSILIAASLLMPFRALELGEVSSYAGVRFLTSFICRADCDSPCELEVDDDERYFEDRQFLTPPADFHSCIASQRCMFIAEVNLDPRTCRPPPMISHV